MTLRFSPPGGQSSYFQNFSKAHNSKPEVEIHFLPTAFFTVPHGTKSATYSVRTTAPQVGDIAKVPRPQKILTPIFSKTLLQNSSKIIPSLETSTLLRCAKHLDNTNYTATSRLKNENFRLGGPDPQMGGPGPQWVGALYRGPKGAHSGERTAAISLAVTEKIEFEKNNLAPSSGETGCGRGPRWRM